MARYLLDTNHLSPLVTPGHQLRSRILLRMQQSDSFAVPVPALTEFLFGIRTTRRSTANLREWDRLQDGFGYFAIGRLDAELAAVLQATLRREGRQLATVDSLIAIVALRNQLILLTSDGDFGPIPRLQRENWLTG